MDRLLAVVLLVMLSIAVGFYALNYYRARSEAVKQLYSNMNTLYSSITIIDNYNSTYVIAVVKNPVTLVKPVPVLVNSTWVPRTRLSPGDIVLVPKP